MESVSKNWPTLPNLVRDLGNHYLWVTKPKGTWILLSHINPQRWLLSTLLKNHVLLKDFGYSKWVVTEKLLAVDHDGLAECKYSNYAIVPNTWHRIPPTICTGFTCTVLVISIGHVSSSLCSIMAFLCGTQNNNCDPSQITKECSPCQLTKSYWFSGKWRNVAPHLASQ